MGSTWGGFLKPLKLDLVQYTAALSKWCFLQRKSSTVCWDISLNLFSTYEAQWACAAFVDVQGSVSVDYSAAESNEWN